MSSRFIMFLVSLNLIASACWWLGRSNFIIPIKDWRGLVADGAAVVVLSIGILGATWIAFRNNP